MRKLEHIFVILVLLLSSGFGQGFTSSSQEGITTGSQPFIQVAFALIYCVLFVLLVLRYRSQVAYLVPREKWTAAICLWVLASTLWSVDSGETFRRSLAMAGSSMAGMYLGIRYGPKQQLKIIALVVGLGVFASFAAVILAPGVALSSDGTWQGIYNSKNLLGRMMSLGALCFALLALGERRHRVRRAVMFLLCCALLVMSKSATGVVVTAMLLALLPFRKLLYLRTRKLIAVSALLLPLASVVIFFAVEYIDEIFLALGRTSSLSGRIPLWRIVIEEIAARPIRGYGFAAFWTSWEGQRVSDTVSWDVAVPHAHNGFLEVTLGLGLVGVTLLLLSIGQGFRGGLRIARDRGEIENAWPLLFIVYSVLYNLTESSFIAVNGIYWMAFVANSFWLVRAPREESRETKLELAQEQEPAYSV